MSSELRSLTTGLVVFAVGLVVHLVLGDVELPFVSLRIVGFVLMVVGGLEVIATLGHSAWRAIRAKV
ncbi:DUF5708 family protein [Actinomycetospora sp. CA-084318]|uniref:DUF5708 family protein n=1 Tax=Actinomycetospora sp. CA-084318 TaxID=3239892 RepID=UPI003D9982EB